MILDDENETWQFLLFIMKLCGVLSSRNRCIKYMYVLYHIIVQTYFFFVMMVFIIYHDSSIFSKLPTIIFFLAFLQYLPKHWNLYFKQSIMMEIINELKTLSLICRKKNYLAIKKTNTKTKNIIMFFMYLYISYIPVTLLTYSVKHFVQSNNKLPLTIWISPPLNRFYLSELLTQLVLISDPLFTAVVHTSSVVCFTQQLSFHIKMLIDDLTKNASFRDSIILHRKLTIIFLKCNRVLARDMSFEIILSSFYSSIYCYMLIKKLKMNEYDEILNTFNILLYSLMAPFIFCFCGNLITKQGDILHRATFENEWYQMTPQEKKDVLTLMMATSADLLHYRYFRNMIIGMPTFAGIIQGTYSYSAAIFTIEGR